MLVRFPQYTDKVIINVQFVFDIDTNTKLILRLYFLFRNFYNPIFPSF